MWPREICFAKYLVIEQKSDLLVKMELPISLFLVLLTGSLLGDNGCEWVNEIKNNLLLL